MSRESIITLVLGLVLGVTASHFLTKRSSPPPKREYVEASPVPETIAEQEEVRLKRTNRVSPRSEQADERQGRVEHSTTQTEIAELMADNEELQQQVYELTDWIDNHVPVEEQRAPGSYRAHGSILTGDHRLAPEVATALNLSGTAYETVSAALAETFLAMESLRNENMIIKEGRAKGLNIKIPNLSKEGATLEAELQRILREQMGDERYELFVQANWSDLERQLFYFGQGRQSLRFRNYRDRKTGDPKMWYQDRFYFPQGEGKTIIYQQNGTSSNVPSGYEAYVEWEL